MCRLEEALLRHNKSSTVINKSGRVSTIVVGFWVGEWEHPDPFNRRQ